MSTKEKGSTDMDLDGDGNTKPKVEGEQAKENEDQEPTSKATNDNDDNKKSNSIVSNDPNLKREGDHDATGGTDGKPKEKKDEPKDSIDNGAAAAAVKEAKESEGVNKEAVKEAVVGESGEKKAASEEKDKKEEDKKEKETEEKMTDNGKEAPPEKDQQQDSQLKTSPKLVKPTDPLILFDPPTRGNKHKWMWNHVKLIARSHDESTHKSALCLGAYCRLCECTLAYHPNRNSKALVRHFEAHHSQSKPSNAAEEADAVAAATAQYVVVSDAAAPANTGSSGAAAAVGLTGSTPKRKSVSIVELDRDRQMHIVSYKRMKLPEAVMDYYDKDGTAAGGQERVPAPTNLVLTPEMIAAGHQFPHLLNYLPVRFVPTCDLYDQYEHQIRVLPGQWHTNGARVQFCGPAVTVQCYQDNSRIKELVEATMLLGQKEQQQQQQESPECVVPKQATYPYQYCVLVVDGGGSNSNCALLGDMLALAAMKHAWAGIIIHGFVRDVAKLRKLTNLGIMSSQGATPRKSVRRGQGIVNVPITIGDVVVRPGDFVYGDEDGVVVLPVDTILPSVKPVTLTKPDAVTTDGHVESAGTAEEEPEDSPDGDKEMPDAATPTCAVVEHDKDKEPEEDKAAEPADTKAFSSTTEEVETSKATTVEEDPMNTSKATTVKEDPMNTSII